MEPRTYRLVTRSDFDGLVCAVLLKSINLIDRIKFVHPKDMQDGQISINDSDITTNLPYVEGAHLVFDHHASEVERIGTPENLIIDPNAPSAARVVYEYYGGKERFPHIREDMMIAVDKADSAQFSEDDILNPQGWELLNFLMDPRTGLGRFREFRISNYQLMMELIDYCATKPVTEILEIPDVKERVELYFEHQDKYQEQVWKCARIDEQVVIVDYRQEETIYAGNRFALYGIYPQCGVSIHVMWGLGKMNTVIAVGRSILNKTNKVNIGSLMLKHGGGGHAAAGTCQVQNEETETVLKDIIATLNA